MLDMIKDMLKEYRELYPNEEIPEVNLFDVSGDGVSAAQVTSIFYYVVWITLQ